MPKVKTVTEELKSKTANRSKPQEPLWKGPEVDGVTQSLLGKFIVCRERFRVLVVEGLKEPDRFQKALEYGNMWHICEEAHAKKNPNWEIDLLKYCQSLIVRYPLQQEEVDKWYQVCKRQFPRYVAYWAKHPDVIERRPLLQEEPFSVPYNLPSGRIVLLRGKFDSVDLIGRGKLAGIFLQENKTKSEINEPLLRRQLTFDLQTMFYLVALDQRCRTARTKGHFIKGLEQYAIRGIRYNVIKRPLSGGVGNIRQHQPTKSNPQGESKPEFFDRLATYFDGAPQDWFMRWQVLVTQADIDRFKWEFLNPCLESLCDWWEWISYLAAKDPFRHDSAKAYNFVHYRTPFGIWNPLADDVMSEVDDYLETGLKAGLERATTLFPELE